MTTLTQASRQWATRPADERFTSLHELQDHFHRVRDTSKAVVVSSHQIEAQPDPADTGHKGLVVVGPNGGAFSPTHWAFGQLAQLSEAPAGYLRTLPAPIAADCINYGLKFKRNIEDVGILLQKNGDSILRAATGPRYGRIWNSDVVDALVGRFGDGISGHWRVPGEFGKRVTVDKSNTTLFASDRDMFIFLADEDRRIEIPNRRDGKPGSLARGFFLWNSEVGSKTFGIGMFLFDYVCCNRIVWGASDYQEITIRHTVSAPDKWLEEVKPILESYAEASDKPVQQAIEDARKHLLEDKLDSFLAERFGKRTGELIKLAHEADEQRPIESLWDVVVGATAYARTIEHQDSRIEVERVAGAILG